MTQTPFEGVCIDTGKMTSITLAACFVFYDLCYTLQLFWTSFWYMEYTECVKNTWQFLKFENQSASYVLLSHDHQTIIMYTDVWNVVEMEHWLVQHWIATVESFIKTELVTAIYHGFH